MILLPSLLHALGLVFPEGGGAVSAELARLLPLPSGAAPAGSAEAVMRYALRRRHAALVCAVAHAAFEVVAGGGAQGSGGGQVGGGRGVVGLVSDSSCGGEGSAYALWLARALVAATREASVADAVDDGGQKKKRGKCGRKDAAAASFALPLLRGGGDTRAQAESAHRPALIDSLIAAIIAPTITVRSTF